MAPEHIELEEVSIPPPKFPSLPRTQQTFLLRHTNPRYPSVFATHSPHIAHYLRVRQQWKTLEISCPPEEHPYVSQSCIIANSNGTVSIDESFLQGKRYAAHLRAHLVSKGVFAEDEVDVKFVGTLARRRDGVTVEEWIETAIGKVLGID